MNNEIRAKLGALVKAERERRGIVLSDLAEQLKISEENLLAIESGDPTALPSELYYGLFAKSYTEAVGIDYTRTVEAIKLEIEEESTKTITPPPPETGKKRKKSEFTIDTKEESSSSEILKKLLYIVGVIVGLFVIFLVVNQLFLKDDSTQNADEQPNESQHASASAKDNSSSEYASYDWDSVSYPKKEKLTFTIKPKSESWSTILADGDTVIYRTLNPGRIYNVEADYRLLISIGIPSAVTTLLNGTEVNLRDPDTRRISRVEINQINYKQFLEQPEPTVTEKPKTPPPSTQEQAQPVQTDVTQPAEDSTDEY